MDNNHTYQRLSGLSQDFRDAIARRLLSHSIGIIRLQCNQSSDDVQLIGSGTLVHADEGYGILTAHHVLEAIPSTGQVGFILPIAGTRHRYVRDVTFIERVQIARGNTDSEGPDLGFIRLPDECKSQVEAWSTATFYDLSSARYAAVSQPFDTNVGVWAVCGFPDEFTKAQESSGCFDYTKEYQGNCLLGPISREYSSGSYDYLELVANYENALPSSFGGLSGGGLWHIILEQPPQGSVRVKAALFSGVVFYQSGFANNRRVLRCHGRRSVYRAYEYIVRHFGS